MQVKRIFPQAMLMAATCALLFAAPVPALAEPPPGQAGWMYEAGTVVEIDLSLSAEAEAKLETDHEKYVKGTFSLAKTDGTPGGAKTPVVSEFPMEIRLKGNEGGSFRKLDKKAAFKLKFSKEKPFLGLRKMTLNNMVEDYSQIHETLAYRAFRAAGVPSSRTGFAWVRLNDKGFGIYLNLENLDKVNLERWFGPFSEPPQHLYEGEYGVDVTPGVENLTGKEGGYEVDEGDDENIEDLEALVAAVNSNEGPGWGAPVASVVDLAEMTRMWAVEKYVGHWDGYSGEAGPKKPNNYYLYSSSASVFQMLPWGTDNTWQLFRRPSFDGDAGLLFDDCLADPACEALYRKELRAVGKVAAGLGLDSFAAGTAKLLKPWEELEQGNGRSEHDMAQIENGVDETREFIAARPVELASFLGPEESSPVPTTTTGSPPPAPLGPGSKKLSPFFLGHSRREAAALVTHLWFPGPGVVTQVAEIKTAQGAQKVCSVRANASGSGGWDLRCPLSGKALSLLGAHGLTLRAQTSFTLRGGTRESRLRHIHLARLRARSFSG